MNRVIRDLRRAALLGPGGGPTDGQLLESFVTRHEEAAFEALLRRHGPMVLGVCRRVLGNESDAEDAFQATFLVLVRKAGSLRSRELVGNFLYGVAYRTALKARSMNAKRRTREREAQAACRPEPPADGGTEELLARLDQELSHLPDKYRVPVVLCELEGKSRKEVARTLGLAEGTLSWRLAQARKLLARRLARYGVALSATALAAVAQGSASAAPPPALLSATARAGMLVAAGETTVAGAVPARVAALTDGVMKAMLLTKLKVMTWVVLLTLCAGVGAVYQATAVEPKRQTERPQLTRPVENELESLRLEIEALRKGLQATRDRVKVLEDEVRTLKGKGVPMGMMGGGMGMGMMGGGMAGMQGGGMPGMQGGGMIGMHGGPGMQGFGMMGAMGGGSPKGTKPPGKGTAKPQPKADPLADAEKALKKLRTNPGDKQATEALERALQQLKEGAKPKGPGGGSK